MENWGLLIHREVNLLYDQRFTTSQQRQRIALVISHEIAHMWFGDLVSKRTKNKKTIQSNK